MSGIEETKRALAARECEAKAAVQARDEAREEETRRGAAIAALGREREACAEQSRAELGLKAKLEEVAAVARAAARVRRIDEVEVPAAEQALAAARKQVAALDATAQAAERRRAEAALEHQKAELADEEFAIAKRVRAVVDELDGLFAGNRARYEAIRSAASELDPRLRSPGNASVWAGGDAEEALAQLKGLLRELDERLNPPSPDPREEAERAASKARKDSWGLRMYEDAHGLPRSETGLTFGDDHGIRSPGVEIAMAKRLNEMAESQRAADAASQEDA